MYSLFQKFCLPDPMQGPTIFNLIQIYFHDFRGQDFTVQLYIGCQIVNSNGVIIIEVDCTIITAQCFQKNGKDEIICSMEINLPA